MSNQQRMSFGNVDKDGSESKVALGSQDWRSQPLGKGVYRVTFLPPFNGVATVVATCQAKENFASVVTNPNGMEFDVYTYKVNRVAPGQTDADSADSPFSFIAISRFG